MSNAITGDFDVVAQFTILAADRVLAAMHQTERFLHSLTASVDDNPSPGTVVNNPVVVGVVDAFGDAVTNQNLVGKPQPLSGSAAVANPLFARVDPIINAGVISAGGSVIPSHLSGTAQLQLFPPTVDVPDNKGSNLLVRMNTMARYFPDKNTAPLAEFIRGDLFITAAVNQIAVPSGHMVNIALRPKTRSSISPRLIRAIPSPQRISPASTSLSGTPFKPVSCPRAPLCLQYRPGPVQDHAHVFHESVGHHAQHDVPRCQS